MKEEYGYCRISTSKQNIDRQERNILEVYPSAHIIKEVYTGTKTTGRKEWNKLYKLVKQESAAGKEVTIIFDSVSRMSRNAEEGFSLYEELFNLGISLVFLKEPHINTYTYKKALEKRVCAREVYDIDTVTLIIKVSGFGIYCHSCIISYMLIGTTYNVEE